MSRSEDVLIDCDQGIDEVAAILGRLLGLDPKPAPEGGYVFTLGDTAEAWLVADSWLAPDLSGFNLDVEIRDDAALEDPNDDTYAAQQATARRVFDVLAEGTPWRLALMLDNFSRPPVIRDAKTAA